ncbi:hypothetical protein EDE15_3306 [Edaphobacter aggregans]|uniref:Uncharacterized protein n=1 Tax=Edaphobacter aggregans TaxID=570835 RepID=A0A428MLL7_9BACT|nr:hypothetical protein [Edaphobacter aggregans]RSL17762.1 hypothetical protein EDE15_3306 [Edaphobacter aggregans]
MTAHRLLFPLVRMILYSTAVCAVGFLCTNWMLRVKDPSEGINTFLLKMWITIGSAGVLFFFLLELRIFR